MRRNPMGRTAPKRRIKLARPAQVPQAQFKKYHHLFSRPHILVGFSLPEEKIRADYAAWLKHADAELKRDGFTSAERKRALKDTYAEYRSRVVRNNEFRKRAAQDFAGYPRFDPKADNVVIPVITGEPNKVRLKFDKHGRPYLIERDMKTDSIRFDPVKLARGKRAYLEKLLAPYKESDRFFIMMGDAMTVRYSGGKAKVLDIILRMMGNYGSKLKDHDKRWNQWLQGVRVMHGAHEDFLEYKRQSFARLHREMHQAKREAKQKAEALAARHRQSQGKRRGGKHRG